VNAIIVNINSVTTVAL